MTYVPGFVPEHNILRNPIGRSIRLFVWDDMQRFKTRYDSFAKLGASYLGPGAVTGFTAFNLSETRMLLPRHRVIVKQSSGGSLKGELFAVNSAALSYADVVLPAPEYTRLACVVDFVEDNALKDAGVTKTISEVAWIHYWTQALPASATIRI